MHYSVNGVNPGGVIFTLSTLEYSSDGRLTTLYIRSEYSTYSPHFCSAALHAEAQNRHKPLADFQLPSQLSANNQERERERISHMVGQRFASDRRCSGG